MSDDNVSFIRLKCKDDVIAEVVEVGMDDDISYMLINPLKVVYIPHERGGALQVAFMPWVFPRIVERQEFIISREEVLIISQVSDSMCKYYWDSIHNYLNTKEYEEPVHEDEPEDELEVENEDLNELIEAMKQRRTYH